MKKDIIEFEFDLNLVIDLPSNFNYHKINGKHLLIAPLIPSWLVLDDIEKEIFDLFLAKKTAVQIINMSYSQKDVINLLAKISFQKFNDKTKSRIRKNLYSATLYLTNDCNLRCVHCYMFSGTNKNYEIDYSDWFKVIKILKNNGVKTVTLTGGEPMMKKGFFEILDYLKKEEISIILLTNGTLITEKNYQLLSERCSEIQISLDGPNKLLHEKIRGTGTFDKTINAIRLLANSGVKLFIAMTPVPDTIDEFERNFPDFINRYDFLKMNNVHLNVTPDLELGREISETDRFKNNDLFYEKVKKIVDLFIEENRLEKREMLALIPGEKKLNCGFAESFTVLWDGTFKRCLKDDSKIFLNQNGINHDLKKLFKKDYRDTAVTNLSLCNECDLRFICGGSCRVENLQKYDNLNNGSCNLHYKQHLYNLLLASDNYLFDVL
jgi:radical SAM protein with 4Fe4S-binding SPASM domain